MKWTFKGPNSKVDYLFPFEVEPNQTYLDMPKKAVRDIIFLAERLFEYIMVNNFAGFLGVLLSALQTTSTGVNRPFLTRLF